MPNKNPLRCNRLLHYPCKNKTELKKNNAVSKKKLPRESLKFEKLSALGAL